MGQNYCTACNCKQKEDSSLEVKSKPNLPYNSNISSIQHSYANSISKPSNENNNLEKSHKVEKSIIEYYKKHVRKIIILQSMVRGFLTRKKITNFGGKKYKKEFKEELNTYATKNEINADFTKHESINDSSVSRKSHMSNEKKFVKDFLLKNGAKYTGDFNKEKCWEK